MPVHIGEIEISPAPAPSSPPLPVTAQTAPPLPLDPAQLAAAQRVLQGQRALALRVFCH